jgi:3-oxoacyl-[acyl-carrier-protein] synthase-3
MMDWTDRNTCVLFGDGAGAVVLSASAERCGVLASELGSDGSGGELLIVRAGGSRAPASYDTLSNGQHFLWMNGREVFRFATTIMPKATEAVVRKAGWHLADLSLVIPHQANIRIIDASIKRLGMPPERFFVNLERYGNTSAASIPIALCEAVGQGRLQAGDKMVLVGFGAGLTWAAAAVEWGMPVPVRPEPWWRLVTDFLFGWAGVRSLLRRTMRHVYNWILGPVGKDDWRGRMRQRADRIRKGNGK